MYVYVFLTKTNAILNHEKICLRNQLLFALNFFYYFMKNQKKKCISLKNEINQELVVIPSSFPPLLNGCRVALINHLSLITR